MFQQFRLGKNRRNYEKKLCENYRLLYKNMAAYIRNSTLSGYETEMVLNEILDLLLESQQKGHDIAQVNKIIGNDYEVFCQSIIDEYNIDKPLVYKAMKYLSRGITLSVGLMLVFALMNAVMEAGTIPSLDIKDIIVAVIWGFVFMPYVLKRFRRMPSIYNKNDMLILSGTAVLVMVLPEAVKLLAGHRLLRYSVDIFEGIPYLAACALLVMGFAAIERIQELKHEKELR